MGRGRTLKMHNFTIVTQHLQFCLINKRQMPVTQGTSSMQIFFFNGFIYKIKTLPLRHCSREVAIHGAINHAALLREISMCPYSIMLLEVFVLECTNKNIIGQYCQQIASVNFKLHQPNYKGNYWKCSVIVMAQIQ